MADVYNNHSVSEQELIPSLILENWSVEKVTNGRSQHESIGFNFLTMTALP